MKRFLQKHSLSILLVISLVVLGFLLRLQAGNNVRDYLPSAIRALEAQGYTDIQPIGIDDLACQGTNTGFAFEATINDHRVQVVACNPDGGIMNPRGAWYLVNR